MMQFRMAYLMLLFVCFTIIGCGGATSPREPQSLKDKAKDLVPLTGEVTVDGSPAADLSVTAVKEDGLAEHQKYTNAGMASPVATIGSVAPDGKFSFTTRDRNDGLPPGKYILFFTKVIEKGVDNPKAESFNSQYGDPETSTYKVTLEKGTPQNMGKIDLKAP